MPCIVTTVHHPEALATACRRFHLSPPERRGSHIDACAAFGLAIRLRGVRHEIVINTLTGLVAYHAEDNAFHRYARIMKFIYRCYEIQARLRRDRQRSRVA